jgi:hypothetical protein
VGRSDTGVKLGADMGLHRVVAQVATAALEQGRKGPPLEEDESAQTGSSAKNMLKSGGGT